MRDWSRNPYFRHPNGANMPLISKRLARFWSVLAAVGLGACDSGTAKPPAPLAPTVTVSEIVTRPIALSVQYAGRAAAVREVEILARVSGILQAKSFGEVAT